MEYHFNFDGLEQDCSNSSADALELLQSFTKPFLHDRIYMNLIQT